MSTGFSFVPARRRSPSSSAAVVAEAVPAESLVGSSCEEFQASETGRQSLRTRTDCRSLRVLQPWANKRGGEARFDLIGSRRRVELNRPGDRAFLGAGLGWGVWEYLGRPLRKFYDLRGEVFRANVRTRLREIPDHRCGLRALFEDLGLPADELSTLKNAQGMLRELASHLPAYGYNETAALYVAKKLCYDPPNVASCVGISIFLFSQNSVS
jgi:hypothetical protein